MQQITLNEKLTGESYSFIGEKLTGEIAPYQIYRRNDGTLLFQAKWGGFVQEWPPVDVWQLLHMNLPGTDPEVSEAEAMQDLMRYCLSIRKASTQVPELAAALDDPEVRQCVQSAIREALQQA